MMFFDKSNTPGAMARWADLESKIAQLFCDLEAERSERRRIEHNLNKLLEYLDLEFRYQPQHYRLVKKRKPE